MVKVTVLDESLVHRSHFLIPKPMPMIPFSHLRVACFASAAALCQFGPVQAQDAPALSDEIKPAAVLAVMERVADWQLANPSRHPATDWTQGAGDAGVMALAGISGNRKYRDAMVQMGEKNGWKFGPRAYHADDHCVGQTYAELYLQLREPKMIAPMQAGFDAILANLHAVSYTHLRAHETDS